MIYKKNYNTRSEREEWWITAKCVPIMLKSFENGVEFIATEEQWQSDDIGERFRGCVYDCWDNNDNLNLVKVSNDERRRLIPILKRLLMDENY